MGLTSTSTGAGAADTALVLRRERPDDRIVALAGNPNVGKSTAVSYTHLTLPTNSRV